MKPFPSRSKTLTRKKEIYVVLFNRQMLRCLRKYPESRGQTRSRVGLKLSCALGDSRALSATLVCSRRQSRALSKSLNHRHLKFSLSFGSNCYPLSKSLLSRPLPFSSGQVLRLNAESAKHISCSEPARMSTSKLPAE